MTGAKVNIGNNAQQGYSLHGLNFKLLEKSFSSTSNDSDFLKNSKTFSPQIQTLFNSCFPMTPKLKPAKKLQEFAIAFFMDSQCC